VIEKHEQTARQARANLNMNIIKFTQRFLEVRQRDMPSR
jgi:hypothetical protein